MDITYISACFDNSGYAEAARNHIAALVHGGANVSVFPVSFENFKSDLGSLGEMIKSLVHQKNNSKIHIIHLTPDNYSQAIDNKKYNIGYAAWETDRIPSVWVAQINQLDELWVPCKHNVEVFKNSGVAIPVYCMPHPIDKTYIEPASEPVFVKKEDEFTFYSIFQWTERKHPNGLLKAYLSEFNNQDNVNLVIKTYLRNPNDPRESEIIKEMIKDIKSNLRMEHYPRVSLITSLMSRQQIQSLHKDGDAFVLLHRCEGFGLPVAEAMITGNPVVTTGYGGPSDFVIDRETGFLVSHQLTPVYKMPWGHYKGNMNWAEPNLYEAQKYMRHLYENRDSAHTMGESAKKHMTSNYSWKSMGQLMCKRLKEIESSL